MLILPSRDSLVGKIVGIDPGTINLGFAVMEIYLNDLSIKNITAITFSSDKLLDNDPIITAQYGERMGRICAQKNNLVRQLKRYEPFIICCESPYYNRLRPNAFMPLVEVIYAIKTACIEYNIMATFLTYEPSIIKKAVGANAIGDKLAVKKSIFLINEITDNCRNNLDKLTDHAIDAIAVCFTQLQVLRGKIKR